MERWFTISDVFERIKDYSTVNWFKFCITIIIPRDQTNMIPTNTNGVFLRLHSMNSIKDSLLTDLQTWKAFLIALASTLLWSIRIYWGIQCWQLDLTILITLPTITIMDIQTWMKRIYKKAIRDKMVMAMHKTTKIWAIGCRSYQPVPDVRSYIQRNYQKIQQWALYV